MRRAPGAAALITLLLAAAGGTARAHTDAVRYVARIANVNRVGLNVTNYGFFGNNFTSR